MKRNEQKKKQPKKFQTYTQDFCVEPKKKTKKLNTTNVSA